jgi:hypothetical protein
MRDAKAVAVDAVVWLDLIDVQSTKRYDVRWDLLLLILVYV